MPIRLILNSVEVVLARKTFGSHLDNELLKVQPLPDGSTSALLWPLFSLALALLQPWNNPKEDLLISEITSQVAMRPGALNDKRFKSHSPP